VTMVSEALKQGPKASPFALAGRKEKIHRRVALAESKRVRQWHKESEFQRR
jgi:hypothetical protein